jgi:uncharacterized protein (DUF2147 family)
MSSVTTPLAALALALIAAAVSTDAFAGDPTGLWLTEDGDAKIRVTNCGGAICGAIAWLKEPNDAATGRPKTDKNNADASLRGRAVVGVPIVLAMKPSGTDKWAGQVYNAEDGKTYSGNVTLVGANTIKLQGCVGGFICKTKTWTRTN